MMKASDEFFVTKAKAFKSELFSQKAPSEPFITIFNTYQNEVNNYWNQYFPVETRFS